MNQEEMIRDVRKRLFEMQDTGYRDFHARLILTVEKEKIIGIRTPILRKFAKEFGLERFLPFIDNWATCDLLALHMMKKHRDVFIREVFRWIESDQPYTIRFGISMLMRHYLDEEFKTEYPEKVAAIRSEEYYVNMMRAWYFSTALAKQYENVLPFLEKRQMDVWTHNKTIQKAIESYRITSEQKEYLRTLRIKK